MDLCFGSMRFGGIAEMIVRIPSHCSNLNVQKRLFDVSVPIRILSAIA